jgi:LCP family protein required for cell wall assembly
VSELRSEPASRPAIPPAAADASGASLRHSPALAGFLSFLFPGLGQLLVGRPRRALLFAAPVLLLLAAGAAVWFTDRQLIIRAALNPTLLLGLVGASLLLLAYRSWAILDAYFLSRRPRGAVAAISTLILVLLLGVSVYAHGWVAYVGWSAHQTLTAVFNPDGPSGPDPGADASASASPTATDTAAGTATQTPSPTATPAPEWAADGRLNVLLIGSDAGPGRWSMRADAIILVSIDVDSGRVAAFSVPRYSLGLPLPTDSTANFACRCFKGTTYANAIYVYANQHPDWFPGKNEDDRGMRALTGSMERLFGVRIDGTVVADLNGFVKLVDAIGGITVNVPSPVFDDRYRPPDGGKLVTISFKAGKQHMDGWHALAYARTRHQDGDLNRMKRQQIVIQSLGRELKCDVLGDLPALLEVARDSLWTNLPLDSVPEMLQIDPGPVESHLLFDVYNPRMTSNDWARVASEVAHTFDGPPPKSGGGGSSSC